MLDKLDLTKKTETTKYEATLGEYIDKLSVLQRTLREQKIPVIIVIEGWNASGITMTVHEIVHALDPRGYTLYSIDKPSDEERAHPFLWRFWLRVPSRGRITIFARSWYTRVIAEETHKPSWEKSLKNRVREINTFERQLADDGTVILKFFLHITKAEQKSRLEGRERNPLTACLVTPSIWNLNHHYDDALPVFDDFIEKTDTPHAPWTLVEATDPKYAILKVYATIIKTLEKKCEAAEDGKTKKQKPKEIAKPGKNLAKRHSRPEKVLTKDELQETLSQLQVEMLELHYLLFKRRIPLIIVYEGWDAAGKGGNITRVTRFMNPLGYYVVPVSAPTEHERDYHYLRRFIKYFPRGGDIAVFDRSWYGRVLVERVEKITPEADWQRAYQEINEMEEEFAYSTGGGIVKFWLEISKEEQLKRFNERSSDPKKVYKITDEDWRNREKWDQYDEAVDEMLARTSTDIAPWTIVESDDKWFARVKALKTVIAAAQKLL